jgi:Flp pilus assembly protein TadG
MGGIVEPWHLTHLRALLLRGFAGDRRGASAVEFALLLPVMIALYISSVEISEAVSINRKVTLIAHTVADLVAQTAVPLAPADVSNCLAAAGVVAMPYSTTDMTVVVSQVVINPNGTAQIDWSQSTPSNAAYAPGTTVTVPSAFVNPNATTYLILGQTSYAYAPQLGYAITGTLTLSDQIYLTPRLVTCVGYTGTTASPALCSND